MRHDEGGDQHIDHHDHEKIVMVTSATTQFEAETYVAELAEADIKAFISGDDAGGMYPTGGLSGGYAVMVLESDVARARAIIATLQPE